MAKPKPPWYEAHRIMNDASFSDQKVIDSQVWAAKDRKCPRCGAEPYNRCRNLADISKTDFDSARENKFPHSDRIDYDKLKTALNDKGYW